MDEPDGLVEWAAGVPEVMRNDPIWRLPAYRYSLYLGDLLQQDVKRISGEVRKRRLIDQLLDAVESISANIAEGYSRTTGPERARFFEYAHSSAREAREWLFKVRHALQPEVATARILLVTRIMKILAAVIPRERAERETRARHWERRRATPNPYSRPGRAYQRRHHAAPSSSTQRQARAPSPQLPVIRVVRLPVTATARARPRRQDRRL